MELTVKIWKNKQKPNKFIHLILFILFCLFLWQMCSDDSVDSLYKKTVPKNATRWTDKQKIHMV